MGGHSTASSAIVDSRFDVLVIGGGISGINSAYRISTLLPSATFAVLESRHEVGGTWSLFKYPGVRSDSDLHTFGFPFNPWKSSNTIASGESILTYMKETVDKFALDKYLRFGQKVESADWKTEEQRWRLEVDVGGQGEEPRRVVYWTKWLILGTGYYSYEKPLAATIPGLDNFKGNVAHPQFWPEDLQYKEKKVVVIGSGATAITLLPALVNGGAKQVTQLQRSPSYIMSMPQPKPEDESWLGQWIPECIQSKWIRFIHILAPILLYNFCIYFPARASSFLRSEAKKQLPADFPMDPNLKPQYKPWEQRLCLCPDGDYFKSFESSRAKIVTDTIKTVTTNGIELNSGETLDADVIVTATGLQLRLFGGMHITVDGKEVDVPSQYLWHFAMVTGIPNFGNLIGYWNHSWTLGSDISARLFVRVIKHMNKNGYTSVVPEISEQDKDKGDLQASPLSSTYVKHGLGGMPKCAVRGPWRPRPNYFVDRWRADTCDLGDGLRWDKISI